MRSRLLTLILLILHSVAVASQSDEDEDCKGFDVAGTVLTFNTNCPKECESNPNLATADTPSCELKAKYGAKVKAKSSSCSKLISTMTPVDIQCVAEKQETSGLMLAKTLRAIGNAGGFEVPHVKSPCDDFEKTTLAEFYEKCPRKCTVDVAASTKEMPPCRHGYWEQFSTPCQIPSCAPFLKALTELDMKCFAEFYGWKEETTPATIKYIGTVCGANAADLAHLPDDPSCDTFDRVKLAQWNKKCLKDCGNVDDDNATRVIPKCKSGEQSYGSKCNTNDCHEYLNSYTMKDAECYGKVRGGLSKESSIKGLRYIAGLCLAGSLPNLTIQDKCQGAMTKWNNLNKNCARDCTNTPSEVTSALPLCKLGERLYGNACQNQNCRGFLAGFGEPHVVCVEQSLGLSKGQIGGFLKYVGSQCGEDMSSLNGEIRCAPFNTDVFGQFNSMCPRDCTANPSEITEKIPQCPSGQREFGSNCQTAPLCKNYLRSWRKLDAECFGVLFNVELATAATIIRDVSLTCLAGHLPQLMEDTACDPSMKRFYGLWDGTCPQQCTNTMSEVSATLPLCGVREPEYGAKCQVSKCTDALKVFNMQDASCIGMKLGIKEEQIAGFLKYVGSSCGIDLPYLQGDKVCGEFNTNLLNQWPRMCPKDCTNSFQAVTNDMPLCAKGQDEYGTKCKSADCKAFLELLRREETQCFGAAYSVQLKQAANVLGTVAHKCGISVPSLTMGTKCGSPSTLISTFHNTCGRECTSDVSEIGLPHCKLGESQYGTKCQTNACKQYLTSMNHEEAVCLGQALNWESNATVGILKHIGIMCDASLKQFTGDMQCASAEITTLSWFNSMCPKDCTKDPAEITAAQWRTGQFVLCKDGEQEYGTKCQTANCKKFLESFTKTETLCLSKRMGLDLPATTLLLRQLGISCGVYVLPTVSVDTDCADPALSRAKFDNACPPSCTNDESEVTATLSACAPHQSPYEQYQAYTPACANEKCTNYLESLTQSSAFCLGKAKGMNQDRAAGWLKQIGSTCGANLEHLAGEVECAGFHARSLSQWDTICPRECTNDPTKATKTLPVCKYGELEFGKKCQISSCQAYLGGFAKFDISCFAKAMAMSDDAAGGYLKYIGNLCGANVSHVQGDVECAEFNVKTLSQWNLMCPKDCTTSASAVTKLTPLCGKTTKEYGTRCKAPSCRQFLGGFRKEQALCFAKDMNTDLNGVMADLRIIASACNASNLPYLALKGNCTKSVEMFSETRIKEACPQECGDPPLPACPLPQEWGPKCWTENCKTHIEAFDRKAAKCIGIATGIGEKNVTNSIKSIGSKCKAKTHVSLDDLAPAEKKKKEASTARTLLLPPVALFVYISAC